MRKSLIVASSLALLIVGVFAGVKLVAPPSGVPAAVRTAAPAADHSSEAAPPSGPEADFYDDSAPAPAAEASAASSASSTVSAWAYLVGDVETGKIYASSNESTALPVASMSKLITALIAKDTLAPTTTVKISPEDALQPPDGSALMAGESFKLPELLYPLLLSSSNVAAEALASTTSRFDFLDMMSSVAWEIGMPTAYFADPSGLSSHNRASAKDMFALARYLYASQRDILAITRTPEKIIATTSDFMAATSTATSTAATTTLVLAGHAGHDVKSIHPFINDPRFLGGKTGRTRAAGETMLTILNIDGHPIAFIVLGSAFGRRAADTELLIQRLKL